MPEIQDLVFKEVPMCVVKMAETADSVANKLPDALKSYQIGLKQSDFGAIKQNFDFQSRLERLVVKNFSERDGGILNENFAGDGAFVGGVTDSFIGQKPQFAILTPDKKKGLKSIIQNLKVRKEILDKAPADDFCAYGDTSATAESLDSSPTTPTAAKPSRRRRLDRISANSITVSAAADYVLHNNNNNNNNNHVKNERLSPGTPDTSSRSRSVTPSSASHPDTPPAPENNPIMTLSGRNYSDFMRSLAAKYNNTNPNDYVRTPRNGFPPPLLEPIFKQQPFSNLLDNIGPSANKIDIRKKPEFAPLLNPFAASSMFPPLIDMSSTQTLLAMVRTAKEAELQGLLKSAKRQDASSPLDLSSAGPPPKRPRTKTPSTGSLSGLNVSKRAESVSPRLHEDISSWTVDDVCNFVSGIDICAEYTQNFREQRIDGSGLPLLTEEHLTTTMGMKLGPALKLRSMLTKKLGSCSMCLHCTHCHNSTGSPEPTNTAGNTSDSGGAS